MTIALSTTLPRSSTSTIIVADALGVEPETFIDPPGVVDAVAADDRA
ncbi:MAG: hypothetical protein R3A10_07165 [Caldilineaceae bacterium]